VAAEGGRDQAERFMALTDRGYRDDTDLPRMLALVGQAAAASGPARNLHLGDVLWRRYMLEESIVKPRENVRLWEEDGDLVGFAWFSPPGSIETQTLPERGGELFPLMLDWGEARRSELAPDATNERAFDTDAYEGDAERVALLRARGYSRDDEHFYLLNHQTLDGEVTRSPLPTGAVVRPVDPATEIADRVAIHREVWEPSRVTEPAYRRLRQAPGYRSDLDLVAVAPDGAFAAYCICWYDPVSRSGEFEPVGTRAAYREQGYGKAVVTEGLRRLQTLGARSAIVFSSGTTVPANRLYASCGFREIGRTYLYRKTIGTNESS
jgi:GNAT superfamily N-acetyltransferase